MTHPRGFWRGRMRLTLAALLAVVGVAPATVGAQATPNEKGPNVSITEYTLPTPGSLPGGIVAGPDGG
jgi:hypothetical protein